MNTEPRSLDTLLNIKQAMNTPQTGFHEPSVPIGLLIFIMIRHVLSSKKNSKLGISVFHETRKKMALSFWRSLDVKNSFNRL